MIGNEFKIEFYDNYANNILNVKGEKVNVSSNVVKVHGVNSSGERDTTYELSSVITITVDGNEIEQVGNTVLFIEEGLNKSKIQLPEVAVETSGGTLNGIDQNLNKIKNMMGNSRAVIVCSQLNNS